MGLSQKLLAVKDHEGKPIDEAQAKKLFQRTLAIGWPSTVEGALLSIIGSVDTMMVGTLGAASIAAVGLTGQPRMILLIVAQALCIGTTALCARRKGAGDEKGVNACLNQSMALISGIGILMTLIGYFGAEWLMKLGGANEDTLELSTAYFRIISLAFLPQCWQLCICAAMRAIGKTRVTMVTNITANLINVCLNYVLINGKLGFPAMGVRGAALATACGTIASSMISFFDQLRRLLPDHRHRIMVLMVLGNIWRRDQHGDNLPGRAESRGEKKRPGHGVCPGGQTYRDHGGHSSDAGDFPGQPPDRHALYQ